MKVSNQQEFGFQSGAHMARKSLNASLESQVSRSNLFFFLLDGRLFILDGDREKGVSRGECKRGQYQHS